MRLRRDRRLHLLEVGVRWPPETFVGWKLEGLAAHGFRVTVAANQIFDPDARLRGVELLAVPMRPVTRPRAARVAVRAGLALLVTSPRRLLRLVRSVRRRISSLSRRGRRRYGGAVGLLALCLPLARLRPDVVHFEWHVVAVDYLPLFDVWGCPVTTSCRGSDIRVYTHVPGLPEMEPYASGLPEVLGRVRAVHCVSESLKREAVAFGLDPAKAWVARPAVDPQVFKPAAWNGADEGGRDGDVLRIVTVGWLRWEKGHEYALEAIRMLVDRDVPVRLEMLGAVPSERRNHLDERARVLHTVADLGLERHVRLRGGATSAEISRRLQASDVLLHAAVTEGIPNAIVEAMACGLPVVAAGCGGVPEAVTNGVEGFLVPPRHPERMAEAVLRLQDAGLRKRMGEAGRRKVLAGLTLEHEHGVFLAMYRETTGG
jgi:colanic acid/amylovoran biosynthesis glycosyltransferase